MLDNYRHFNETQMGEIQHFVLMLPTDVLNKDPGEVLRRQASHVSQGKRIPWKMKIASNSGALLKQSILSASNLSL